MLQAVQKWAILRWLYALDSHCELLSIANQFCWLHWMAWLICSYVISVIYKGKLLVNSFENVMYPRFHDDDEISMSYFIIINLSITEVLEDFSKKRENDVIHLLNILFLVWYKRKGALVFWFILLPSSRLLFPCHTWDNDQATCSFWDLWRATEYWGGAPKMLFFC